MSVFNIRRLVIAVVFTGIVIFLTHVPNEAIPDRLRSGGLDKLAHIAVYGAITFLFVMSLRNSLAVLSALLLFFAILALGTIDELTQPLVHRTASLTDWLANVIGVLIVLLSAIVFKPKAESTQAPTPEPEC